MKKNSFKYSRKLQAAQALAAAAVLSACAGAPTPCVEPALPEATESAAPAKEDPKPSAPCAVCDCPKAAPECPSQSMDAYPAQGTRKDLTARNSAEPSNPEDSKAENSSTKISKQEVSRTEDSKVEPSKAETSKVEQPATPGISSATPLEVPADPDAVKPGTVSLQAATDTAGVLPPDPYQDFPALANSVFAYADSLYRQGKVDSAVAYLQRFRIIKPLWSQWENTADSLLNEFGKTNAELARQFEPLVLQIKNMNRVQTSYSIVAETADSLIALSPGDSLTRFAQEQKKIAYGNTLRRAQKEMASIRALAEERAKFEEARQRALEFQMRHRDFEDELKIQAFIDYILELAQTAGSEASRYWESHDPAKAMEEAAALIVAKKFAQAKELLTKLKASNLRKEAMEKYVELADAYCNAQRKETSQLFAKAQKQKNPEKKKELLQSAVKPLDKCIDEYPESTQIQKVRDNKKFLEKEIEK